MTVRHQSRRRLYSFTADAIVVDWFACDGCGARLKFESSEGIGETAPRANPVCECEKKGEAAE